jgi:hypothetical protein
MKTLLLIVVLGSLLATVLFGAAYVWQTIGDVELSLHGTVALALGVLASLGLGVGLMFLVFYSSRRGHDDDAGR